MTTLTATITSGDTLDAPLRRRRAFRSNTDRVFDHIDTSAGPDGCWPWTRSTDDDGYGVFNYRQDDGTRRTRKAHAVVLELTAGPAPEGLPAALHSCDWPPCCQPRHLRWGTQAQNIQDAIDRGRAVTPPPRPGETHPHAVFTEDDVLGIVEALTIGAATQAALAQAHDVTINAVWSIWAGVTWDHLTGRRALYTASRRRRPGTLVFTAHDLAVAARMTTPDVFRAAGNLRPIAA